MTKMRFKKWVLITMSGLFFSGAAKSDDPSQPIQAPVQIEHVSLFKNGLGFFVSKVQLPEKETSIRIGQLPVPVYGTFWVGYPEEVKVQRLVTAFEDIVERQPARSVGQLLLANPGVRAILYAGPGEKDVVEGVIRTTAQHDSLSEPPSPYFMSSRRAADPYDRTSGGNTVLIETANGLVVLNVGSIVRADFGQKAITDFVSVSLKRPFLRLELEEPAGKKALSLSYLAHGITWTPGYQIDLSDAENALFTAQALVANEMVDLDHVTLDLVTGFPNIRFGGILSPLAMHQSLADFLNSLASGRSESGRSGQVMSQQAVLVNAPAYDNSVPPLPAYSGMMEGAVSEDLFLYPVKEFSLRRGETAYVPLFTAKMPYRHIYTWKIEDALDTEDRYRRESERTDGKMTEEIWHSCRLRNTLRMPLTTASAQFISQGQINGQDLCYYAAPGAETTIRINQAMNLLGEQAEYEVERKRNAASFYGSSYDLVKVRGELKLRSRLDKEAPVEITKELSGEVAESTPGARDVTTAKGLKKVNPKHVLTWSFTLKAREEQTLFYIYLVYVRA